jgi:hypothetical protein
MSEQHDEVVKVASGELVLMQIYQQALGDAGIDGRVVGDDLEASFGSAIQNSIDLYVKEEDFERAEKVLEKLEQERARHPRERES